jgi:signal transduction histidine kinase/CheY-like chemotaxis protein/HAMP domain-containing protein
MQMRDLKIGTRLSIAFLSVILLTLAVGIGALYQMRMLANLVNDMYDHPLTVGYAMRDIRSEINEMHDQLQRLLFVSGSVEADAVARGINNAAVRVLDKFDLVEERFLGSMSDVRNARKAFTDWKEMLDQEFALIRQGGKEKLDKAFYLIQLKRVDDLQDKIQVMTDFAANKARSFLEAAHKEEAEARTAMIALVVVALLFGLTVAFVITRSITPKLQLIVQRMNDIAGGDLERYVEIEQKDEIGKLAESFREMQIGLRNKAEVAMAIAAGDFSQRVEVRGSKDHLGNAINTMTRELHKSRVESDLQDWIKTGKNELNKIIVGQGDMNKLAGEIIRFLAGYLNAQIGTLYVMADHGLLTLCGSFAFSKRKSLAASIEPGEGLVGQAALEKDIISISNIPEDYIRINSSFGDSPPRNIVAVPFLFEDTVKGVVELGSFEEFPDKVLDFLRDVSDSIGIAFHTVQSQARLQELLEQTQRQARQLQVQEEELRTANEELEEQTRSLRQSEDRLKQQQEELQAINEELEEKNDYLEKQKVQIAQKNHTLEEVRRELERRARELEVTGKYKSEFLANMSHELRTPLNSLLLLSRDLAENSSGNLLPEQVKSAEIIQKGGAELLQLINEILDLSKIEAGRMSLKVGDVNLREVAEYIERTFRHVAMEKGVALEIVTDDTLPDIIKSDRQRLEQILKNLVSNALKFTDRGSVKLDLLRPLPEADLSRSGLSPNRSVAFSVKDTGIGIPDDKQILVFEAFQQVDGGTTRRYGGTGLGLSISRELAKLLGGEIQLESRYGEGSTFTLYLPLELTASSEERKAAPAENRRMEPDSVSTLSSEASDRVVSSPDIPYIPDDRYKLDEGDKIILIIEDDQNFAKVLVDKCHAKGFKALASPNGETGLDLAEKYLPAAVMLDIKLPGMNGWTVLNSLKANPGTRHIPVHIVSVEEASINAMQKGAIGFLNKPVNREDLEEAFKKVEVMVDKKIKDLLIVEDNSDLRSGIVNLIADSDVNIVEVENGVGALEAMRDRDFDCMILDLGLPDMTGFDLLNKMADEKDLSVPPVIVYTGKDLAREEEMELRKHAESIIIKGVRSEERLLDEVALFLHKTVSSMPPRKREMIINLHDRDGMFADRTILVVDDDMRNLFALSKVLSEKGMNVLKAEDGKKAMAVLEERPDVDLVLLDIMMPVMDGYQTAREIRRQRRFHDLPIIALTAKAMKDDRDKCIAAGASDYLSKPVDVERLLSMLRVWLYKRPSIV